MHRTDPEIEDDGLLDHFEEKDHEHEAGNVATGHVAGPHSTTDT